MDILRLYLNSLSSDERDAFCAACGTSLGYLRKALSLKQLLGPALCVSIARESKGVVTRQDLRPDDWRDIWPEIAEAEEGA